MGKQLAKRSDRSNEPPDPLTPGQRLAVAALVAGRTLTAAAELAGVSRPTIYAWRDSSVFEAELNRCRVEQRDSINDQLRELASSAMTSIKELIESPTTPPGVKLSACQLVLECSTTPRSVRRTLARSNVPADNRSDCRACSTSNNRKPMPRSMQKSGLNCTKNSGIRRTGT